MKISSVFPGLPCSEGEVYVMSVVKKEWKCVCVSVVESHYAGFPSINKTHWL